MVNKSPLSFIIYYLRKKGVLNRIGPDKGGYWKVVKK